MRTLPSHFRPPSETKTEETSPAYGTGLEMQSLGFVRFWTLLYFSPTTFFREHYRPYVLPHFAFAMIVVGIASGISMTQPRLPMSTGLSPAIIGMRPSTAASSSMTLIALAGFLGIPGALFHYFVGGFFYNLRIRFSGGTPAPTVGRFINLYTLVLPCAFVSLGWAIHIAWLTLISLEVEVPNELFATTLFFVNVISLACPVWAVVISHKAVTIVCDVYEREAHQWFFVVPLIFYASIFVLMVLGSLARKT